MDASLTFHSFYEVARKIGFRAIRLASASPGVSEHEESCNKQGKVVDETSSEITFFALESPLQKC
jgi:hypothetical protein